MDRQPVYFFLGATRDSLIVTAPLHTVLVFTHQSSFCFSLFSLKSMSQKQLNSHVNSEELPLDLNSGIFL